MDPIILVSSLVVSLTLFAIGGFYIGRDWEKVSNELWKETRFPPNVILPNKFLYGTRVKHVASGRVYVITEEPSTKRLLENTCEPYYRYHCAETGIAWVRSKAEMEGGRFTEQHTNINNHTHD